MNLHVEHNWYYFYSGLQLHNRSATVLHIDFLRFLCFRFRVVGAEISALVRLTGGVP